MVLVPDLGVVHQEVHKMLCKRLGAWLGICHKAGAVVSGYALLQKAFVQARLVGVILAEDIAVRRAEEYRSWCVQYAIPCVTLFTQEELGHMLGKPSRSAVGVTEAHFFDSLHTILASLERLQATRGAPEAQASFS
jgi:ribosomal protein L7Ae-like RNA K-turn-binding protein